MSCDLLCAPLCRVACFISRKWEKHDLNFCSQSNPAQVCFSFKFDLMIRVLKSTDIYFDITTVQAKTIIQIIQNDASQQRVILAMWGSREGAWSLRVKWLPLNCFHEQNDAHIDFDRWSRFLWFFADYFVNSCWTAIGTSAMEQRGEEAERKVARPWNWSDTAARPKRGTGIRNCIVMRLATWLGDSKGNFSSSQAAVYLPHTVEASHSSFHAHRQSGKSWTQFLWCSIWPDQKSTKKKTSVIGT